jgi:hypothetical protein
MSSNKSDRYLVSTTSSKGVVRTKINQLSLGLDIIEENHEFGPNDTGNTPQSGRGKV